MNTIDDDVRDALDVWRCDGRNSDWGDVLVRARTARPGPGRQSRRPRVSLALAALAGFALAATPALGLTQRLGPLVGLTSATNPGLVLTATLNSASARGAAHLELQTSRVGIAAAAGGRRVVPFVHVSPGQPARRSAVRWQLTFAGIAGPVREATLALALPGKRAVLTLCAPCESGASGSFQLTRAGLTAMFNGLARAELRADNDAAFSGLVELARP